MSETLALPSEMVELLSENPLSGDKDKSEDFMKTYLERYYEFQKGYQYCSPTILKQLNRQLSMAKSIRKIPC